MKILRVLPALLMVAVLLGACAPKASVPYTPVVPQDLGPKVAADEYEAKVDNFVFLIDASSSMARPYTMGTRYETARGLAKSLNETLPELPWKAGLRLLGPRFEGVPGRTALVYGMEPHSRAGLGAALDVVERPAGTTPLANAMCQAGNDAYGLPGKTAMVIFTDAEVEDPAEVLAAAARLQERYQGRLCVYPVMVGDSPAGLALLEGIVQNSTCGFVSQADELTSGESLASFATKAFLAKKEPVAVKPKPAPKVEKEPMYRTEAMRLQVNFAFDRAEIRPSEHDALARFAAFLKQHPEITSMEIGGHTCNMGPADYNLRLSQRRAENVVKYLVDNFGIAPDRLTAKGYGESKPLVSNDTLAGRQQNRRVEAVVTTRVRVNK